MGNAGSMNQHTDPRGHHMPLKLPMPEPAELEERFALVLVCTNNDLKYNLTNNQKEICTFRFHLFYSILFYSILFYSILFYSILIRIVVLLFV